jgi:hypothetical protein
MTSRPRTPATIVDEDEFRRLWFKLPDFITPDYRLDIPPARLPFVKPVFTEVGAPRFCPQAACRRARACQGGDGPPCFRADRKDLSQVLFLWWVWTYGGATEEECAQSLRATGNRYAPAEPAAAEPAAARKRQR